MILPFLAGVKYKGKIYFSMRNGNGLFSYDPVTDTTSFLKVFPKEKICDFLHLEAFLYNNEMWLVPLEGDYITCVNLDTLEMQDFFARNSGNNHNKHLFYSLVRKDDLAIFLPNQTDTIVKVNLKTKECEYVYSANYFKSVWAIGGFLNENTLNVVRNDGKVGLRINVENNNVIFEDRVSKDSLYHYFVFDKNDCWMIPRSGDITHGKINNEGEIDVDEMIVHTDGGGYYRGLKNESKIVFYPYEGNQRFVIYNANTGITQYEDKILEKYKPNGIWFEINTIDSDEGCWASATNGAIIDFSDLNSIRTYCAAIDDKSARDVFREYRKNEMIDGFLDNSIVTESKSIISLEMFISFITGKGI